MKTDTIAAISTAVNNAGISIVRMSGEEAVTIIDKIYQGKNENKKIAEQKSHTIHYGHIKDGDEIIDEVLVAVMRGPNSYTKEDVIEINCHGGIMVTKRILETLIKYGARPAEPGEFTKRAFLNGRIDLSQAEAVMDIINAKNDMALKSSVHQLKGNICDKITEIRDAILHDVAFIEAALDDPEHISVDGYAEELLPKIKQEKNELVQLLRSADNGRIIKEGINTVILGKPNAGKSSLLNVLAGEERAIVTDIEGTTRDVLEEEIKLGDIVLNLIDTAGIRSTEDYVEQIGVEKARKYAKDADLIIYVADASTTMDENDKEIIELIQDKKILVLLNKIDKEVVTDAEVIKSYFKRDDYQIIEVSAKEVQGMEDIESAIKEMFFHGKIKFNDEIYITNIRHKSALQEAIEGLDRVEESIENEMPEDFYTIDLMQVYEILGEIIGETVNEDLVNTIFREFCMGK